jgi:hypothetical protein
MRREAYIGANEVNQLVGKWQNIVGGAPWQNIVGGAPWQNIVGGAPWQNIVGAPQVDLTGAETQYTNPWWGRQAWSQPHHHHHHHHRQPWWQHGAQAQYNPYRAELERRAYISGDPVALGALALLGADPAAAGPALPPGAPPGLPPLPALPPPPPPPMMAPAVPPPMAPPIAHPAASAVTMAPPATPTAEVPPEHPHHPDHHLPQNHPHHPAHPTHPHHRRYRATGWAPAVQTWGGGGGDEMQAWPYMIPPRNLMVDRPGPTGADRVILPMSSGVNILPNTSAQITSRPQNYAFRPERVIISGSADWVINDIKVGNMSQFSQSGDVPGEMFGAQTIDGFVKFTTCQTAMDFVIVTTFVGASESGAPFVCGVLGTAAVN